MSPFVKLQIRIMSNDMASSDIGQVLNNLKDSSAFARQAKAKVQECISAVRSANDVDPNWTDDQICQMILDQMENR